jgi:putative membrane protein
MEDSSIRDTLALERTRLANERTFLAYIRTALALIAGSAVLFQFFSAQPPYLIAALLLIAGGGCTFLVGLMRFLHVKRRLTLTRAED